MQVNIGEVVVMIHAYMCKYVCMHMHTYTIRIYAHTYIYYRKVYNASTCIKECLYVCVYTYVYIRIYI